MRAVMLLGLALLFGYVHGAPSLSCVGVNPRLLHDGQSYQVQTRMIDGANAVDAHVEIDGHHDIYNVRLIPSPNQPGTYELPKPIEGHETSPISFHLTYMGDAVQACDTQQFGTQTPTAPETAPAPAPEAALDATPETTPNTATTCSLPPIEHQVMKNDEGLYYVTVMSREPLSYVDLHATIGISPETTTRIAQNIATSQSPPMSIPAGEALTYYLTYAIGDVSCNTGFFATGPLE